MASKSLYVGNLPFGTSQDELRDLFAQWNPTDIRVVQDKGFGFVDVPEEQAQDIIAAMNGKDYRGRALTVNEARPRSDRPRGDRRGGGGGGERRGGGGGGYNRRW